MDTYVYEKPIKYFDGSFEFKNPIEIGKCRDKAHAESWFEGKYGFDEFVFSTKPLHKITTANSHIRGNEKTLDNT